MQDTVDHADGAVSRTLADIIEDAPVRVWPLPRRQPSMGVLIPRYPARPGLHLARFARAGLRA